MSEPLTDAINTLSYLHSPGSVFELCLIAPKSATSALWEGRAFGKKQIVAGWFRDQAKAAKLAVQAQSEGVYVTLNPCQEALLGRAHERLKANADRTGDEHIAGFRNLLIDLDPRRPSGVSSSEAEHESALEMAKLIREDLGREGWPEPLVGDSGNGGHLVYALELATTEENKELLKGVLAGLAARYAGELEGRGLEIDQKVFNPSRLTKLYGTMTGKGENLPERPHRQARIITRPEERQPVAERLLRKIAIKDARQGAKTPSGQGRKEGWFDLAAYLAHYGVGVVKIKPHGGGQLYCLEECLFDPSHADNEAAIGQSGEGKLFYQCFHNSCRDKTWTEARERISGAAKLGQFMVGGNHQQRTRQEKPAGVQPSRNNGPDQSRQEPSPAPAIDATASEKSFLPIPPPFPLEVFPGSCQRAITEIQRAHGVPVEIPGCAFLGMAGGCIGRTRGVRIKQGWLEYANLWFAIVAPSGYGKSPAVREIQRPIFKLEKEWFSDYQEAQRQYILELERRRLTPKDERATLPPPPDPPEWRQLIVDDTTTEALTDALAGNPRGIAWTRDELAGLLQDLDKYARKEGGTKARMMSAYDSGHWKVNRREASKRAFIPHATLSIFGTIQPKALPSIFSDLDAATGFLPRFIFVSPTRETPPLWTDETVSGKTRDYLTITFEKLLTLDFDEEGEPIIIGVSREAKDLYENWFNEQVLEPWKDFEASVYEAVLAKLRGQCLRIALILHCHEAVDSGGPDVFPMSLDTMEKAITLANFFKAHQRNAWQSIVNRDKVADLPPLPRQVGQAILSLEGEIRGGMLATARITEQVNLGLDTRFHVSPDAVGKTAPVLKMVTDKLPDRTGRGFRIKPEDIQRLHSYFPSKTSVPCVPSDHSSETTRGSGENPSDHEVSQVTGSKPISGHLGHLPDTCKIPEGPHGSRASDTSDTSDTSFNTEDEILFGRFQ